MKLYIAEKPSLALVKILKSISVLTSEKQFKIIRDLIAKATTIVNASDPERKGQLLVD